MSFPPTVDVATLVVADEIPKDDRLGRSGRTWVLRWNGGDTTAMTEDEADQIARALRYWIEHGAPIQ